MTVALTSYAIACFPAQVTAQYPGILSFDAGAGDFIAVVVCWEDFTNPPPPVIYDAPGGPIVAQVVTTTLLNVGSPGAIALYAITLPSGGLGACDLKVSPTPGYAGWTSVTVWAYSGSSHRFGAMVAEQYGTHDFGVQEGTTIIPGCLTGSIVAYSAFTTFGLKPTGIQIAPGDGWVERGSADALNHTAFASTVELWYDGEVGIEVSDAEYTNLHVFAFEVTPEGTPLRLPDPVITNVQVDKLVRPGNDPGISSFDCMGGDILIVCVMRSNSTLGVFTDKQIDFASFGGRELRWLPQFSLRNIPIAGVMDLAVMMSPPQGVQEFFLQGFTGNVGFINVMFLALRGSSGVIGVRHASSQGGNANQLHLGDSKAGSLMVAIEMGTHTYNTIVGSYGWELIAYANETGESLEPPPDPPTQLATWVFAGRGGPGLDLVLTPASYSSTFTIALEMQPALAVFPDRLGIGSTVERRATIQATGLYELEPVPNGQQFHAYYEIWHDWPSKAVADMQPDDFILARLPSFLDAVNISFAKVQGNYTGLDDSVRETMGMYFPGSARLLRDVIATLKSRVPNIKVYHAIQQWNFDFQSHYPYDPGGWGGLNADHLESHRRFVEDTGMDGIVLDYEVSHGLEAPTLEQHCYTINGKRYCYTDEEQMKVIRMFREYFPRPFPLFLTPTHVGAYGEDEYTHSPPDLGWNSGYQLCLHKNPDVCAMLDGFHLMTYDAGGGYDPRQAVRAYQHYFPTTPLYFGIRVGPPDYAGVKITGMNFRDYANTCIKLGLAGAHMYSIMWDCISMQGLPDGAWPPYGDYNWRFPDGNVATGIFARSFRLPYGRAPTLNNPKMMKGAVIAAL